MASTGRNLHPIKFKRSPEQTNGHDDISQLFQSTKEENSESRKKRNSATCSSWFGERELIVYKLFYMFFYAATALFAYLPLYFKKSLLLDHHHVGILMGIRPFCGFLGAPILGSFADKFNKYKSILYSGLLTYMIVYLSITFVNGVPKDCGIKTTINQTHNTTNKTTGIKTFSNAKKQEPTLKVYEPEKFAQHLANVINNRNDVMLNNKQSSLSKSSNVGKIEKWKLSTKPMYFHEDAKQLPHKSVVFENIDSVSDYSDKQNGKPKTNEMEFQMLVDNTGNLTQETGQYNQHWLYAPETAGEDTWPIDIYRNEPPQESKEEDEKIRNHIFLILLLLILTAELIGAPILSLADTATLQTLRKEPYRYGHQLISAAVGFGFMSIVTGSVLHYTVSEKDEINSCPEKMGERYKPVFYSSCALLLVTFFTTFKFKFQIYEGKEAGRCSFFHCFQYFNNLEYLLFAFLTFFTGLGAGLTDSFLFVHLIRLGATPLVLVVTTTVQSVSKAIFFYLSPKLILKYGNFPVIYAGMLTSVVTFFCYSFLASPWMVVPIESLSGLSYSCVWAAIVSYVGAPPKIGATLQGIVHSLHIGLGRGIGGLFGGMILLHYGFDVLFRSFSLIILVVVAIVFLVRYRRKDEVEPIWSKLWDYSPIAPYDTLNGSE